MKDARWIWLDAPVEQDSYGEFVAKFSVIEKGTITLKYAADSCCAVFLNGELINFGSCADYPHYKLYRKKDITKLCKVHNEIIFNVWYFGEDNQNYIKDDPGIIFEITQGGKVLAASGAGTLSRKDIRYKHAYKKWLTPQLGYSFYFDNRVVNDLPYTPSVICKKQPEVHLRRTPNLRLGVRKPCHVSKNAEGYLIDMHEERVGFLDLDLDCGSEQEILVSYGEHLDADGKVPRLIDKRDFSVEFYAKEGHNQYMNPFRRLAGRYLQVVCKDDVKLNYAGIRFTNLPVRKVKRTFADSEKQKIYDIAVNTLRMCMHEHYEDCPWREQGLYVMDSRNQMLCGYYAFKGSNYQRENLKYISKGMGNSGLLSICFPAGVDYPIPSFSAIYFVQVAEYVRHTGDRSVLRFAEKTLRQLMKNFTDAIDETGLIPNYQAPCWNFYEWSAHSANDHEIGWPVGNIRPIQYDLIMNCLYVYAAMHFEELFGEKIDTTKVQQKIHETFYVAEKGMYKLSTIGENYSQLGNSLAVLINVADETVVDKIINNPEMIRITLSMNTFLYDAMRKFGHKYDEFIMQDILEKYRPMLRNNITNTFWETEDVFKDFGDAGSLCHGWSAMPIYYMLSLE